MSSNTVHTFDDAGTDAPEERPGPRILDTDPEFVDELRGPTTTLDELRTELGAEVEDEPHKLPVPTRDGWEALFSRDLEGDDLQRWRKASKDRHMPDGVDELAFALRIVANLNVGLIRRGEELLDQGEPLIMRSETFLDLVGAGGKVLEGVRKFYGRDGHVLSTASELLREAGYDDDLGAVAADPTVQRTRG